MGARFFIRTGICLAATILAITALAPMAQAQTDLRGRWNGFSETQLPAVQMGDSFFDVFTQARGRFTGAIEIHSDPVPHLFPVSGFVLPNGVLFGSGRDARGLRIDFSGRAKVAVLTSNIRVMSLGYAVSDEGRFQFGGLTVHIQMQGGLNWVDPGPIGVPDVGFHWDGDYLPRLGEGGGPMSMDLAHLRNRTGGLTTSFMGGAQMMNVFVPAVQSFFDITYDVQGTVGVPAVQRDGSLSAALGAVAVEINPGPIQSPTGIIAILIGNWVNPGPQQVPAVQGQYRLYDSFFDVFTEIALDGNTAFSQGSFTCTQRPPG